MLGACKREVSSKVERALRVQLAHVKHVVVKGDVWIQMGVVRVLALGIKCVLRIVLLSYLHVGITCGCNKYVISREECARSMALRLNLFMFI